MEPQRPDWVTDKSKWVYDFDTQTSHYEMEQQPQAASTSSQQPEYICLQYRRGHCQRGKNCWNRHDEQGMIVPAERRATPAAKVKYGATAIKTSDQWQIATQLPFVETVTV